ncbi:MAG TPA: DUF6093 family protein [Nocardioidaceae bacterium]|nr:DUF6093 family protein [Nocardioidaceae bacterium]
MRPNLALHRSRVARFLTETGQVWKPGEGEGTYNPNTGAYDPPPPVLVYDGACLVRPQPRDVQVVQAGTTGYTYALYRYDVTLPAETTVDRTMWLTLTACPYEPELVGYRLNLVDVPLDAWGIVRRCVGEIVTG